MSDQDNTGYHNSLAWVLLSIVFLGLIWLFWVYQADNVRNAIRWARLGEIWFSSLFVGEDYVVMSGDKPIATYGQILDQIPRLNKTQLNAPIMDLLALATMSTLKYVFSFFLLLMSFWALFKGPRCHYRTKLDLTNLIKRQSINFPVLSPFVKFNPSNQPPRPPGSPVPAELPLFAEALSPEEWIAYYDIPVPNGKLDESAAARAFSLQLGPPWRGTMHMAPHRQVLMAAFALKSVRKRGEADNILGRLAQCWSPDGGMKINGALLREARKILRDKNISGKMLTKCNQHAFENTVILRALATAREEGGVMAPAQFVWLRGHDRALWYPLNNLGRQSYHMEALGTISHYKSEKMAQRPIPRPKTEDPVKVITEYISSSIARPIPALDYSKSKKRAIKQVKK